MTWEFQRERRLERDRGFVERRAADVAVGAHHRRRDVTHLRVNYPIRLPLLGQARERRVASVVEAHVIEPRGLS